MTTSLERDLDHSRAAYLFAIRCVPESAPASLKGVSFSSDSQIESMVVEFGWAFFCRYEACLEAFLKKSGVALSKKKSLLAWLQENNVQIPKEFVTGIEKYRKLRNKLHHEDGASMDGDPTKEIHMLPDHMENFYKLFVWVGAKVESVTTGNQTP